jgi:hypothetical protein
MPIHILRHRKYPLAGYWVAPNGNDANAGTFRSPFRTIQRAANEVSAGQNVWVRGGTYVEQIDISASGASSAPIFFRAAPGERPIVDGQGILAPNWGYLVELSGDYTRLYDIEVRNSAGIGLAVTGTNALVHGCYVHDNYENGVLVTAGGDNSVVEYCDVFSNAMSNYQGQLLAGYWAGGLQAAVGFPSGIIFRHNTVWQNWGEGVSAFECAGATIEDNIIHDSYTANIYVSDSYNVTAQRNLIWTDPDSPMYGYGDRVGIMLGDEHDEYASHDINILNNIVYGGSRNLYWWQGFDHGLVDVLIAYNTLVNADEYYGIEIDAGAHSNVRIANNLVQQDGALPNGYTVADADVVWDHNLWSKANTYEALNGTGDVVGAPLLADVDTHPFLAASYQLTVSSPGIEQADAIGSVTNDYFGVPRHVSTPDIGAAEYES